MKKLWLAVILISFLSANTIKTDIEHGLKLYQQHKYKKAYKLFYSLFNHHLDNEEVNFYLGLSAFKLQKYDKAVEAFERILIKNPNNLRARLEYARSLFYMQNYQESKKQFLMVMEQNIPIEVKQNIHKFLVLIDKLQQRNFYNILLSVGLKYDSNINNDAGSNTVIHDTVFDNSSTLTGNRKKSDFINENLFVLNQIYDMGKIEQWKMDNNLIIFNQNYFKYTKNNILYFSASPGLDYKSSNYLLKNRLFFNKILLDNDSYLSTYGIGVSFFKPLNQIILNPSITFKKKNFVNNNLDAINKNLSFFIIQKLTNAKLNYGISYTDENAKVAEENSYIKKDIKLNYIKNINRFTFNIGYEFFNKRYKEKNSVFLVKRKDYQSNIKGIVSYKFKKNLKFNFSLNYIKNNSTRDANDYNKFVDSANILMSF